MAELTPFSFRPGHSRLHRMDARFKLFFLALISGAALSAHPQGLAVLTPVLFLLILHIRVSGPALLRETRYFLILLGIVFTARSLSTPGDPVWQWMQITVTRQGLHQGGLICWRLAAVVLLGLCLVVTTRPSEIRAAIAWLLKPVPFVPEKRVATMISLLVRFIPLILSQAGKTGEAQRARGIENRKNPLVRLVRFAIPFLRRTFEEADRLVIAMEARCYSENRTLPAFSAGPGDRIAVFISAALCGLLFWL
ncbi:energy-coupling factor transporter transmembrane protein EcfT [Desulfonema ishimotonii]|uniref:Energy-coupling factor transporter transmembrane protein EcfT n=1 Tax=Desulfonema ishimotonii TaxID=45657 RepID=A0A401FYU7_9BACT|nr:energy-coupling factor transporter transmembrane component T [Desulfonema ishimotonii]GBC62172.1 energy-coupling factor transporter transmembrane protein EcfT [Desulfonema ishimotonii]